MRQSSGWACGANDKKKKKINCHNQVFVTPPFSGHMVPNAVCQRQFVTHTVYTLLNADSNHTFLACVLMIDSVMPFRSGFTHGGH